MTFSVAIQTEDFHLEREVAALGDRPLLALGDFNAALADMRRAAEEGEDPAFIAAKLPMPRYCL